MSFTSEPHQILRHTTAPIVAMLSREQLEKIVAMTADDATVERIEILSEKANEGELTDEERAEYEAYSEANDMLAILQAEARQRLAEDAP